MSEKPNGRDCINLPILKRRIIVHTPIDKSKRDKLFLLQRNRNEVLFFCHKMSVLSTISGWVCLAACIVGHLVLFIVPWIPGVQNILLLPAWFAVLLTTFLPCVFLLLSGVSVRENMYKEFTDRIIKFRGDTSVDYDVMREFLMLKEAVCQVHKTLIKNADTDEADHKDLVRLKKNLDEAFNNGHVTALELLVIYARKWAQGNVGKAGDQAPSERLHDLFGSKKSTKENSGLLEEMACDMNKRFDEHFLNKELTMNTANEAINQYCRKASAEVTSPSVESGISRCSEHVIDWSEFLN